MNETPRKVTGSGEECFLCSTSCVKNRIFIYGKSSVNIADLISLAIDVDLSQFSESDDLFVCKNICYKLLLRFQNSLERHQTIKEEIKAKFISKDQVRTKRLLRPEENTEELSDRQAQRPRHDCPVRNSPAAKSLQFSTTCTSSRDSGLSVEQSFIPLNDGSNQPRMPQIPCASSDSDSALPVLNTTNPTVFPTLPLIPCNTSTPVRGTRTTALRDDSAGKVRVTINHPSKTVNKTLGDNYEALGKALVYGPPSRIATAVINCEPVRKEVIQKVLRIVSKEVDGLCSRQNPSMLRQCGKDDLPKFDFQLLCQEWANRAPVFYSFLVTSACKAGTTNARWLPSVAVSGSILLKERNPHMNATASVLGILLKTKSLEANLARFAKMKITCSNRTVLAKLDCLGENHTSALEKVKEAITEGNILVKVQRETLDTIKSSHDSHAKCSPSCTESILKARGELEDLEKASHPGFIIGFDNIDIQLQRKSMTQDAQNRIFHWVNHRMVSNRVSGCLLPANGPKAEIMEVQNLKFFPSIEEHQQQRLNYATLVSRMLVQHFDVLEPLKKECVQHIPHKHTKEMSQKSSKVPLGVIFKNENVNEDMLHILNKFQTYLPKQSDGGYDGQLFAGDQLTVERAINVIASVANGYSPDDRLEGINLQLGDWHAGVKLLTLIYNRFFSGKSEGDSCTLFSDRTLINRRNVTGDPRATYRPDRDFLTTVLQSRIIAAAMKVLGIENKSAPPSKYPLPPSTASRSKKLDYLMEVSTVIVDKFIFESGHVDQLVKDAFTAQEREDMVNQQDLTEEGRFPCRSNGCPKSFKYNGKSRRRHELTHNPPPDIPEQAAPSSTNQIKSPVKKAGVKDDVFNYNCALLADGFLFLNFLDAVAEGDGTRIMRQYKYIMLYCKADGCHSTKYALECLYQFCLVYALLSPRDSERFIWNRSVNNACRMGTNIPLDLDVEHSNNFVKQAIRNLGPNVSENAVSRISNSEAATRSIVDKVDDSIVRVARSGRQNPKFK